MTPEIEKKMDESYIKVLQKKLAAQSMQICVLTGILVRLRGDASLMKEHKGPCGQDQYTGLPPAMRMIDDTLLRSQEFRKQYLKFLSEEERASEVSDFSVSVLKEHPQVKALVEVLEIATKSLLYYGNENFDRVCFLDHSTCNENYGADAREILEEVNKYLADFKKWEG